MALGGIIPAATKEEIPNRISPQGVEPGLAERVYLDPGLIEALRHVGHLHYVRLVVFLVLYLSTAYAACWMAREIRGSAWVYVANIPLYLLAAASLHGISLFTHEGVHGTLSLRRWWNRSLSI